MAIPRIYRKAQEVQANFDFTDLASGNAFTSFYGTQTKSSAATSHALLTQQTFSNVKESVRNTAGTTTLTFESAPFNLPRTVKGTAYFNLGVYSNNAANWLWVQISKYDGATQTNISASHAYETAAETKKILMQIPCTETKVNPGEKLRFVISQIVPGGGGDELTIGIDPQGRTGSRLSDTSGANTILKLDTPFKIVL